MTRLIALLLLALAAFTVRGEDVPAPYRLAVLLDARADDAERDQALSRLRQWADRGDPFSRYLLGTLYRLGRDHPARLLERDPGRASGLLGHAALDGSLEAMASLAELEYDSGNALAGMMWAQAHIHFSEHVHGDGSWRHRPYEAGLVLRLSDALAAGPDAVGETEIEETWRGFVRDFGERILAGIDRWPGMPGVAEFRQPQQPLERKAGGSGPMGGEILSWRLRKRPDDPASVLFLMAIDAKGKVDRLEVVDSRPGANDWKGLARSARQARFNEVADDAPLRWILAPYSFDDGSARLRREG